MLEQQGCLSEVWKDCRDVYMSFVAMPGLLTSTLSSQQWSCLRMQHLQSCWSSFVYYDGQPWLLKSGLLSSY